jgi:hypothetical protein
VKGFGRRLRPPGLLLAGLACLLCAAAGCAGGRADGAYARLSLPGGRVLLAWRASNDTGVYLRVPGFDDVDYARGDTLTSLSPRDHALRRDVFLSPGLLSAHLELTYGRTTDQITAALAAGGTTGVPAWVTAARRATRHPSEVQVDRHLGADLSRLRGILGGPPPCLGGSVAGLPLAAADIVSDRSSLATTRGAAVCVYSTDLVDPARAGRFVTVSADRAGTQPARQNLALEHGHHPAFSAGSVRGYPSTSNLVIAAPGWVVVVSPNQEVPTSAGWRPYFTAFVHAQASGD